MIYVTSVVKSAKGNYSTLNKFDESRFDQAMDLMFSLSQSPAVLSVNVSYV